MEEAKDQPVGGSERRRFPRHALRLRVQFSADEREFRLSSENISLGGIFLTTTGEMPAVNSLVQLFVHLGDHRGARVVPVTGTVLYHVEGRGFGVEFQWWSPEEEAAREVLARYLDELGFAADPLSDALGAAASEAEEVVVE